MDGEVEAEVAAADLTKGGDEDEVVGDSPIITTVRRGMRGEEDGVDPTHFATEDKEPFTTIREIMNMARWSLVLGGETRISCDCCTPKMWSKQLERFNPSRRRAGVCVGRRRQRFLKINYVC